jgi:UDP-N-acetylmuramate dehydrogenase
MVGAKGARMGDIEIADYHANLFVNLGEGTAKDFWNLAFEYSQKVFDKFGLRLEVEVQFINLQPLS